MSFVVDTSVTLGLPKQIPLSSLTKKKEFASELGYLSNASDITYTGQLQFPIIKNKKENVHSS